MWWTLTAMILMAIIITVAIVLLMLYAQDQPHQWPTPNVAEYCYPVGTYRCR